jgi:cytochrome P450
LNWIRTIPNDGLIHFRDTLNRSFLLATNHQALLDVMSTNTYDFEKPWLVRNFLARIIGFGLILSEGGAHRKQRKALTPAFNIKNIRALYPLMWEKTGILLTEIEKEIKMHPGGTMFTNNAGNIELSVWARYGTLPSTWMRCEI